MRMCFPLTLMMLPTNRQMWGPSCALVGDPHCMEIWSWLHRSIRWKVRFLLTWQNSKPLFGAIIFDTRIYMCSYSSIYSVVGSYIYMCTCFSSRWTIPVNFCYITSQRHTHSACRRGPTDLFPWNVLYPWKNSLAGVYSENPHRKCVTKNNSTVVHRQYDTLFPTVEFLLITNFSMWICRGKL